MAAAVKSILAKVLIQVGADEPKEIGTIEIPITLGINDSKPSQGFGVYPPGTR
ncbi:MULTISPECIES: hypothetical protein [Paenarthrobacter]|uniref:Uncharacterized protein n=1 Tax=Paenarthrobacter ureafaciens TaxID=37931 RepID=A0AAX3EFI2_PAEUR|nr:MULTISPECIES: hypothetical protein [Paenarthrobacter]MDO5866019.1 hypothetical protein [Paenarthrobacter sp. SD-2]MDO5877115.1 hypothetical protein [Paenarthrobacter sp. SD-1]UYV92317.1 hypothetical protein NL395_17610 [Paenarthrobacter ureafaciens]UYV96852.1 hypothetical protein NL394_17640 [Paenarthrobacter ureafaciens]WIV32217.1 hypothetical protein QN084_06290 [Paenarthrobacter sp. R1]